MSRDFYLIVRVKLSSSDDSTTALALCDTACSHTWMTRELAARLKLKGNPIKVTVNGINAQETVDTETIELKVSSLSGQDNEVYTLKPYVKQRINVGSDVIDVPALQRRYPHLAPLSSEPYSLRRCRVSSWSGRFRSHPSVRVLRSRIEELANSLEPRLMQTPYGLVGLKSTCLH